MLKFPAIIPAQLQKCALTVYLYHAHMRHNVWVMMQDGCGGGEVC